MVITKVSKTFILGSNPSARAIAKASDLASVDFANGYWLGFEGQERSAPAGASDELPVASRRCPGNES